MYKVLKKFFIKKHNGPLDIAFYTTWYPDLKNATHEQATDHWDRFGKNEGRYPNFESVLGHQKIVIDKLPKDFDWSFYCGNYLDLQMAGINNPYKAILHYLKYGHAEGRMCSPYNDFQKQHLSNFHEINNQAIDSIVDEIKVNPRETGLGVYLTSKMKEFWNEKDNSLTQLAKTNIAQGIDCKQLLLTETNDAVEFMADAYRNAFLCLSDPLNIKINSRRVLIVGDFFLPQCIRYRIEQKLEQLSKAGFTATAVSWTLPDKITQELAFHDVVIFYRVPAVPDVVQAIIQARALGKLTFYEIDDLIFDPVYPPPIESYGGYVTPDNYVGLLKGMALYNSAAKLCEFGIASTQPLADRLSKLVSTGRCSVHRNGLDSQHTFIMQSPSKNDFIDIFYGTGTQAHNSDFIESALPSLEAILGKYPHVRLIIVGYLELPHIFLEKFSQQLIKLPFVKSLPSYWNLLANADINIAVLNRDEINDCKSELKWFEAACFGIPSIVSKTANYEQVINQNDDGIMVETAEDWVAAFERLIHEPDQRTEIGEKARLRVRQDYSIETLSANIETIIKQALDEKPYNHKIPNKPVLQEIVDD